MGLSSSDHWQRRAVGRRAVLCGKRISRASNAAFASSQVGVGVMLVIEERAFRKRRRGFETACAQQAPLRRGAINAADPISGVSALVETLTRIIQRNPHPDSRRLPFAQPRQLRRRGEPFVLLCRWAESNANRRAIGPSDLD
jgi:hypothetical protein